MNAINLLLQSFEAHMKEHKNEVTFKVNISNTKEASGKCNNCNTHFGAKG